MLFENAAKIACVTIPNGLRNMLDGIGRVAKHQSRLFKSRLGQILMRCHTVRGAEDFHHRRHRTTEVICPSLVIQYERDENGNLLVPDYKIENGEISLYTKTVSPEDPAYTGYSKGYGKDYAFALNDTTAFMVFDNYNRSEDPTDNGFIANASGRSWGEQLIAEETVNTLVALTASYKDVYVTLHSMTTNQTYLKEAIKNENVVSVFDGHTHYKTATPNAYGTGKYVFTCGYFGVPMLNDQAYFMERPFSYRMLDKNGSTLRTYIVLPEKDYPEYTFTGSSNATIPAFYQKYLRRKATVIR